MTPYQRRQARRSAVACENPVASAISSSERTFITLAAPLAGTTLAKSPLAQFAAIDEAMDLFP